MHASQTHLVDLLVTMTLKFNLGHNFGTRIGISHVHSLWQDPFIGAKISTLTDLLLQVTYGCHQHAVVF